MALKTKDIETVRGATIRLTATVKNQNGVIQDLTGATAYLQVRPDIKAASVISLQSPGDGIVFLTQTGVTKGQFVATIAPSDTAELQIGDYVWDSWVITATGDRHPVVARSLLRLTQEVAVIP